MPDISLLQIMLANGVLVAGACLQGVVGYGIGTFAAPLLFLISPSLLPGAMIIHAVTLTVLILLRDHQALSFRPVRYAIGGCLLGTALAALALTTLTTKSFGLVFGILILLAVLLSVAGFKPALTSRNSFLAGGVSGFMGTITTAGGPPIALIYQNETGPLVRANLSAFFLFSSLASVTALASSGYIGKQELTLMLLTCPGVLLGFWLSGRVVKRLPFAMLRPIILTIAGVSGLAALVQGILTY